MDPNRTSARFCPCDNGSTNGEGVEAEVEVRSVIHSDHRTHAGEGRCQALLRRFVNSGDPYLSSIQITMITLNTNDTASYAETRLYYLPARIARTGASLPGRFVTLEPGSQGIDQPKFDFGRAVQVFSDRLVPGKQQNQIVGLPHWGRQKFDETQADSLAFEITDELKPFYKTFPVSDAVNCS